MSELDAPRSVIHEALSATIPFSDSFDDVEVPDAAALTGWVVVAEWQGSDGNRWLSKLSGNALGDRGLPLWTERGLCYEIAAHWHSDSE